ncbi:MULTISPECIES: hypothetical protein [Burkholderia cepacia complex]|uniref:hypothetical protein n=1 Tax=Burkholderia cepacia complex TaxID=87882 RepID=UPI0012DB2695|nr:MULTISPECIES: hypothetical protein [Burkholderia cepacia complex]MCA8079901.1 hypothetical protein [Burkholderia cepacia]MCA8181868.1 hypothetical protein [Burkholderia vietnamiensis]UKV74403.1 hypothetical protein FOC29_23850 [Burkholderia vietnamiensis]
MAYEQKALELINFNKKQIHDKESFDFVINDLSKIAEYLKEQGRKDFVAYEYAHWHIYDEFPEYQ